jgi:hypothetical protein
VSRFIYSFIQVIAICSAAGEPQVEDGIEKKVTGGRKTSRFMSPAMRLPTGAAWITAWIESNLFAWLPLGPGITKTLRSYVCDFLENPSHGK